MDCFETKTIYKGTGIGLAHCKKNRGIAWREDMGGIQTVLNFFHKRVLEKARITDHIEIAMNGKDALDILTAKEKSGQENAAVPNLN